MAIALPSPALSVAEINTEPELIGPLRPDELLGQQIPDELVPQRSPTQRLDDLLNRFDTNDLDAWGRPYARNRFFRNYFTDGP